MPKQSTEMNHGRFLEERRLDLGVRWSEVARDMERLHGVSVTPDYLGKIRRGAAPLSKMSVDAREALRKVLRISASDWDAQTGLYSPETANTPLLDAQDGAVPLIEKNKTLIPVYDMAAAAPGGIGVDAVPVRHVEVNPAYLKPGARAFMVLGDSMDDGTRESIADGDVVLVNMNDCDLRDEKTYIVKVPGNGVLIKRVRLYEDGEMYLVSDNTRYRPIRPDEAQIIGRVYRHIPAEREM